MKIDQNIFFTVKCCYIAMKIILLLQHVRQDAMSIHLSF